MPRAHARAVLRCLLVAVMAVGGSACASVPDASAAALESTSASTPAPLPATTAERAAGPTLDPATVAPASDDTSAVATAALPADQARAAAQNPSVTRAPLNDVDTTAQADLSARAGVSAQAEPADDTAAANPASVEATRTVTPATAPRTANAAPATPRSTATPMPAPPSTAGSVAGSLFALLLVLGLILGLAWLAKRLPGAARGGAANGALRVVASVPLGQRERAVVVDVGGTQLLLGVGPGGTRTLHTLSEPLPQADAPPAFAQLLSQHFGKKP